MGLPTDVIGGVLEAAGDIVGAALNPFGLPSKGQWNITKGSFKPNDGGPEMVFFFEEKFKPDRPKMNAGLEQVSDSGGRRKVIYEYPYKDGQRVDDLGRRGERMTFSLVFFGENYQLLFRQFLDRIVKSKASGILTHPVRGQFAVAFQEYEFIHRHDQTNAVTIRATFIEDNFQAQDERTPVDANSALRSALKLLTDAQTLIGNAIFTVGAALLIPNAFQQAMKQRLDSITGSLGRLLSQLSATFSTDAQLQNLLSGPGGSGVGGGTPGEALGGTLGTTTDGVVLPPVFQVGVTSAERESAEKLFAKFAEQNQITAQQAIYQLNQVRDQIREAILFTQEQYGSDGFDIVLSYRTLAVEFQRAVEASVSSAQTSVRIFTVPFEMSLRRVAFLNGLSPDRQNDIERMNSHLKSVNFVPKGAILVVPAT